MGTDLDRAAEREALDSLTKSDGWRLLSALKEAHFGAAAQLRDIDAAMAALQPSDNAGQLAVVTQIRAASKAADTLLALPAARIRQLDDEEKAAKLKEKAIPDRFASLRRGPRK